MKLDATLLRYMSKEDFRVLTAVEIGMKNHEYVPTALIPILSGLKRGGSHRVLSTLAKYKLVHHTSLNYDGYKLTYLGYDFLALHALVSRGVISHVGNQIGVGKESDVFLCMNDEGREMIIKLHRLGRVSFRSIKNNRDYLKNRKHASWLYLSRLAAMKEYAYMKVLYDNNFRVPEPIDTNRHCVIMAVVPAFPLCQVTTIGHPEVVYDELMQQIVELAECGLIHCDFNEFNIMINEDEEIWFIDFPQMVSTSHENAEWYFNRDVDCIRTFFRRKFDYESLEWPQLERDTVRTQRLDVEVEASGYGFTPEDADALETLGSSVFESRLPAEAINEGEWVSATDSGSASSDGEGPLTHVATPDAAGASSGGESGSGSGSGVLTDGSTGQPQADGSDEYDAGDESDGAGDEAEAGGDEAEADADGKEGADAKPKKKRRRRRRRNRNLGQADIRDKVRRKLAQKRRRLYKRNESKNRDRRENAETIKEVGGWWG